MKTKLFTILLLVVLSTTFAQTPKTKTAAIKELLELTGSAKMGVLLGQTVMNKFRKSQSNVPEEFWVEAAKEFNADNFIELIIPIYESNYSEIEINGLIAFYKTTLGQKVISTMPTIMGESMEVGKKWGMQLSFKIYQQLKDKKLIKEK
jgi:hypothetical protein